MTLSVLSRERRNPSVVGLPHYAFVAFAFRLRSLSPSASLGGYADAYRSHAFGGSYGFVLRPPLAGEFQSSRCVLPHAKRT